MAMPLNQLFAQAPSSTLIRELTLDSRKVRPGDLFLAVDGIEQDGRDYIGDAIARGASAVVYEARDAHAMQDSEALLLPVHNLQAQLSEIAGRFYGEPSRAMRVVAVTGTNGKTSVTQLLAQACDLLDQPCGLIGTLGSGFYGNLTLGHYTTPDPLTVQATLADLKNAGAKVVAMEVSSHGLAQHRVSAVSVAVAVLTNLTRDHLDYHGSMQAYAQAKARLFSWPGLRATVLNLDDTFGRELAEKSSAARLITYSLTDISASIYCRNIRFSTSGIQAEVVTAQGEGNLSSHLIGRFNLSNLLAVIGALLGLGHSLEQALAVISKVQAPAGRMQVLGGQEKPLVVVDYAHTADALEQVLTALRPHVAADGRLLCLFGCGGERDAGKRPLMAAVVERLADAAVLTDDNPRGEDPASIRAQVLAGFSADAAVTEVAGRGAAIAQLIAQARRGDVIVLAGKGHEDYQEINQQRQHFSDIEQAEQALAAWQVADV
ncbi:MAG: UDP-N-acetylmuramoyl-L-alanyl-D-glutamate--2,6-diaminopimelate ligase [Pseudomonas sp.]|jgi:UDP-N-acetylmuramoyl-L-alanyl-D-glutamate--2,6-diaminopimelate ligase|nr:UDP-N-acetylmuramoyl-L-alanyl-D-glutamate--2,6-diaminopimelate ligase [Pseudomonas sp.]MDD2221960.1 UDP-N-acetylmuramoyl-L-alanyl-D-glutamate--2,6-diaminopimelate ligase [Pseudomonas sp.]MDY0413298.1 UDP-N-acetylmuramoyl-L-alanyl-D-glutamate--2,6-diaminopimelate ligase [Pseudomonas sp.]NLO53046.1 UDP-N-acetylmuramoyl-L-alanyl-D-glutamate--2,6-diaminopimelate ligase [Gammaproteobacteria bacterium]